MLIYEGTDVFYEIKNRLALVGRIKDGDRPTHPGDLTPPGLTRHLWMFVNRC